MLKRPAKPHTPIYGWPLSCCIIINVKKKKCENRNRLRTFFF